MNFVSWRTNSIFTPAFLKYKNSLIDATNKGRHGASEIVISSFMRIITWNETNWNSNWATLFHFFSNNLNKFNFQFFKILMKNLQQFLSTELWRQSSVIFSTNVFLKIYLSRSIQVYTYTYLYIYISLPCPGQLCSSSLYFLFYFVFLFSFFSSLSGAALLILPLGRVEGEGT